MNPVKTYKDGKVRVRRPATSGSHSDVDSDYKRLRNRMILGQKCGGGYRIIRKKIGGE